MASVLITGSTIAAIASGELEGLGPRLELKERLRRAVLDRGSWLRTAAEDAPWVQRMEGCSLFGPSRHAVGVWGLT